MFIKLNISNKFTYRSAESLFTAFPNISIDWIFKSLNLISYIIQMKTNYDNEKKQEYTLKNFIQYIINKIIEELDLWEKINSISVENAKKLYDYIVTNYLTPTENTNYIFFDQHISSFLFIVFFFFPIKMKLLALIVSVEVFCSFFKLNNYGGVIVNAICLLIIFYLIGLVIYSILKFIKAIIVNISKIINFIITLFKKIYNFTIGNIFEVKKYNIPKNNNLKSKFNNNFFQKNREHEAFGLDNLENFVNRKTIPYIGVGLILLIILSK